MGKNRTLNKKNGQEAQPVKIIFNPAAGSNRESPNQLMDVIKEMQARKFVAEIYLTEPNSDLPGVVRAGIEQGINLFVVCGGDGTVSSVVRAMTGTGATLGIIPGGTQNNVAFSLGIPTDIPAAADILGKGKNVKADIGFVTCCGVSMPFLELCSVGLFSALFESGDDIQHGNISRIGDFLATLTTSPPSEIHIRLDDKEKMTHTGHMVLVSNMPYVGRHYHVGSHNSYCDGLLDILFCSDISKLDLMLGYILKTQEKDTMTDSRIKIFYAQTIDIDTHPAMPVMADGILLGKGPAHIEIKKHALNIVVPKASNMETEAGESLEK